MFVFWANKATGNFRAAFISFGLCVAFLGFGGSTLVLAQSEVKVGSFVNLKSNFSGPEGGGYLDTLGYVNQKSWEIKTNPKDKLRYVYIPAGRFRMGRCSDGDVDSLRKSRIFTDRKSTRLNSSHPRLSRMPSSA